MVWTDGHTLTLPFISEYVFFSSLSCHSLFSKRIVILIDLAKSAFCAIFSFKKHERLLFFG